MTSPTESLFGAQCSDPFAERCGSCFAPRRGFWFARATYLRPGLFYTRRLPVKKATWLYAYGVELPELRWGYTPDGDGDPLNGSEGLNVWRDRFKGRREQWTKGQHRGGHHGLTPPEFRDALIAIARSARDEPYESFAAAQGAFDLVGELISTLDILKDNCSTTLVAIDKAVRDVE